MQEGTVTEQDEEGGAERMDVLPEDSKPRSPREAYVLVQASLLEAVSGPLWGRAGH